MISRTTLPNGLRVVTEYIPHVRSASIGFWLRAGSRYEEPHVNGISHFIEHLVFKGTRSRSARDIAEAIDGSGGHLNAFTAKELTCYYARVLDQRFELAFDLLADMLVNPRMAEEDVEKEKSVILEEIRMYEDTPEDLAHELFTENLMADHPLAAPVLGTAETVTSLTRQAILDYVNRRYRTGNLVVSVAGRVEHQQVLDSLERYLQGLAEGQCSFTPQPVQPRLNPLWRVKDIEQVHLCVGALALPRNDERRFALLVLDTALGGGMSSRLFQELREERALVYSVYTFQSAFQDTGLFGIYAATSPKQAREVVACIVDEVERVRRYGLEPAELERAKEQMKGALMLSLESTSARMSRLAKAELYQDRPLTPDELMARVDAVSQADLAEVAELVLQPERFTCAGVGPAVEEVFSPLTRLPLRMVPAPVYQAG